MAGCSLLVREGWPVVPVRLDLVEDPDLVRQRMAEALERARSGRDFPDPFVVVTAFVRSEAEGGTEEHHIRCSDIRRIWRRRP